MNSKKKWITSLILLLSIVIGGIAPDILTKISELTGIEFEVATDKNTTWAEILERLRTGDVALIYLASFSGVLLLMLAGMSVLFIRNVRTRELYKEASRAAYGASMAKNSFLAKMSHEIRTPMNAIIGMTELALREEELPAARAHILTAKQASVNLLAIINDILDFSKIETGKLEIISGNYLFSSLINDVISIIRMRVIDSQIRFAVSIDSNIPNALIGEDRKSVV